MPLSSFATNIRGMVSRSLPSANTETQETSARLGRYGEQYHLPLVRKSHLLADEGVYFVSNNNQTAITAAIPAASGFNVANPSLIVDNMDAPSGKRIYLDYLYLLNGTTAFSNATSNTALYFAWVVDRINRWSSGGTQLTPTSPNGDVAPSTIARIYFGAVTAAAASGGTRTVVGQRLMRLPVSATALSLVSVDQWKMNFGGVEAAAVSALQSSATIEATNVDKSFALPPIIVGPGGSALLYIFAASAGTNVAGTLFPEIGHWER